MFRIFDTTRRFRLIAAGMIGLFLWAESGFGQDGPEFVLPKVVEPTPATFAPRHNLIVSASEELLNRLAAREQVRSGAVRQCILGAEVVGQQTTLTRVHFDLKPQEHRAAALLILDGDVQSNTLGITGPAVVNTLGRHHFQASKPIFLDPTGFMTKRPTMTVEANNATAGVQTLLSGRPLLGPIADNIALNVAERRRPQSEAIARNQIISRVLPLFNEAVDRQLSEANRNFDERLRPRLKALGLMPSAEQWSSSETRIFYRMSLESDPPAVVTPPPNPGEAALTVSVHESLLNRVAETLRPQNESYSDRQLRGMTEEFRRRLERAGVLLPGSVFAEQPAVDPGVETARIRFGESEPIRFLFEKDRVIMRVRARIEPVAFPMLPELELSLPFRFELADDRLVIRNADVSVKPVDPNAPGWSALQENIIRVMLEANLPRLELARTLPIPLEQTDPLSLTLTRFDVDAGWLTIAYEPNEPATLKVSEQNH